MDKTSPATREANILLQFSRHFIFNSCGSQAYCSQKDSLLFNYLRKIQREIKVSTVADDVLYLKSASHATFLTALKATAWSLSLCHFAPACRCLRVMERALGNIYILNPLYRPWSRRSGASGRGGIGGEAGGSQRTR